MVAGQIDSLWLDTATGNVHMIDWKRCLADLDPCEGAVYKRTGVYPCDALLDNRFNHYVMQQNLYAVILRDHYDVRVESMWLVQLHADRSSYCMVSVPDMMDIATAVVRNQMHSAVLKSWDRLGSGFDDEDYDIGDALDQEMADQKEYARLMHASDNAAAASSGEPAFGSPPKALSSQRATPDEAAMRTSGIATPVAGSVGVEAAVVPQSGDGADEDEDDLIGDNNVLSDRVKAIRRLIPGAFTSTESFRKHWREAAELMEEMLAPDHKLLIQDSLTIIGSTKKCASLVAREMDGASDIVQRLAVGALVFYRMRLCDISLREHVHILWVICGDISLRAHNGMAYHYESTLGCRCIRNDLFVNYDHVLAVFVVA